MEEKEKKKGVEKVESLPGHAVGYHSNVIKHVLGLTTYHSIFPSLRNFDTPRPYTHILKLVDMSNFRDSIDC